MTPFYREVQPLDPELAAIDHDYWFDHAEQDLAATEERRLREAWAQIHDNPALLEGRS